MINILGGKLEITDGVLYLDGAYVEYDIYFPHMTTYDAALFILKHIKGVDWSKNGHTVSNCYFERVTMSLYNE